MVIKYPKSPYNIPNGHKIYKHFPIYDPPKFTQIGILGLKTNHLATLLYTEEQPGVKNDCSSIVQFFFAPHACVAK
jgi:hypothetical protein